MQFGRFLVGVTRDLCLRFTRTHAQLNLDAMFDPISNCQELVQSETPEVSDPELAQALANLLGALDRIEPIHIFLAVSTY